MEEIERIEREIGEFLVKSVPVPWSKICFSSNCDIGYRSVFFCFQEKKTGIIVTQDMFSNRYDDYPIEEMDIYQTLARFSKGLFEICLVESGKEKIWKTMTYIIDNKGDFKLEFSYDDPIGDMFKERDFLLHKYFNATYTRITGKYPSLT